MLGLLQPQLPCMYNSCFDFPWPLVVHGFAADFEHLVIVPFRLCKTRHAVGPRVEVSVVSIVGWSKQARTSTSRTSAAAHGVAIGILTLGFRDYRVTPVLRLRVYLSLVGCRMWAETCLPMIIQPDDGADPGLCRLCLCETVGKRSSAARALRDPSCCYPMST